MKSDQNAIHSQISDITVGMSDRENIYSFNDCENHN